MMIDYLIEVEYTPTNTVKTRLIAVNATATSKSASSNYVELTAVVECRCLWILLSFFQVASVSFRHCVYFDCCFDKLLVRDAAA